MVLHLLDFDFGVMEFWHMFEAMREEKRKATIPASMKLKDNQYWAPKYTDDQILDKLIYKAHSIGPVTDNATEDDIMDIMDDYEELDYDWDPNEEV